MRSFSTRAMVDADWLTVKHFQPSEFARPDLMGWEFIKWLDAVRDAAKVPILVTSSYRTPAHNKAVGGAADSAHCDIPCQAVDIGMRPRVDDPNWNRSRFEIIECAMQLGCVRVGTYADGSIHLDRTEDRRPWPRMWRIVDNPAK